MIWALAGPYCHVISWLTCMTTYIRYPVTSNRSMIVEPPHDKTNKMTCAPSEDSNTWASAQSDQSLHCPHGETMGPKLSLECRVNSDQTGRMPRWIRVFTGCTGHFACIVMLWLSYLTNLTTWHKDNGQNTWQIWILIFRGSVVFDFQYLCTKP